MRNQIFFICLCCILLVSAGCEQNETGPLGQPMLTVQVSMATCQSKVDAFNIRVDGYGSSAQTGPGSSVSFGVGVGNRRVIANSIPAGIDYDRTHFVPQQGVTITIDCP